MKLGAYIFEWVPDRWTPPVPEKMQSSVRTWGGVGYFSWGASIVGKEIELEWNFVSQAQFDAMDALKVADASVVWDLDVAGMMNYVVEILAVEGELPEVAGYDLGYMLDVRVVLLILEETSVGAS